MSGEAFCTAPVVEGTEPDFKPPGLADADIGVIVAYFVIILGVGIWVSCQTGDDHVLQHVSLTLEKCVTSFLFAT